MARYKPVVFEPSGFRRKRRGLPRWLVLLVTGTVIGVSAVIFVQERYLPPRLSASESTELQAALAQAQAERQTLRTELDTATGRLTETLEEKKQLATDLATSRATIEGLRGDLGSVITALPPDPRGGTIQVRAGQFSVDAGKLLYDVMLTRDGGGKAVTGVMQLVVEGQSSRADSSSVNLKPVPVSVSDYQSLRGSLPLPSDFRPSQATVRVLDRVDGRQLGMRVLLVR